MDFFVEKNSRTCTSIRYCRVLQSLYDFISTLAWISHFWIEENKPATFKYPIYSFASDFVMFKDAWLGKVSLF